MYDTLSDAESIRVAFDPNQLSYSELLQMFWDFHAPTDPRWSGTQYRSAIFVHNAEQRALAEQSLATKGAALAKFVAIEDASDFYRAEEYHQKYIAKASGRY